MKGNVLFKFIVPAVLLAVLLIVFVFQPTKPSDPAGVDKGLALTKEEARELGIEGDTPADTLRTLVSELRSMRSQVAIANDINMELSKEKTDLEERSSDWKKQLDQTLVIAKREADSAKQETKNLADQMMKMMGDMEGKVASGLFGDTSDMPIGLGLDGETSDAGSPSMVWIEPSDKVEADARGGLGLTSDSFAFPSSFDNPMDSSSQDQRKHTALKSIKSKVTGTVGRDYEVDPAYTIAENSTLLGSVSMTALIGRVPVDGTVNDPYPFKILIGKENLAANGIDLPDVTGAVMSGTAQGDWTLSCVRGQVETITFAFEDGTIRTVPEPIALRGAGPGGDSGGGSGGGSLRESIGYISDPYGIPCIAGERKSSAKEYIGNNTLVTAAGAAISRIFSKDGSNVQVSAGGTTVTDNNQAFNSILQKGVGDIQDWVGKMYGQAFAAVYVQPHQQIAVHIERELTIDYENFGRKVKHNEEINEIVWLD